MKNKVIVFIILFLSILAVAPILNFVLSSPLQKGEAWWHKSAMFRLDFATSALSRPLYHMGISTRPSQVVIGKEGWLYLGDQYNQKITMSRLGRSSVSTSQCLKIGQGITEWERWAKLRGVRLYKVMLGPDKSSIYPEQMPSWAQPARSTPTDKLLENVDPRLFFDTRPALIKAKSRYKLPLYYKIDTHWNQLGAWVAFDAFSHEVENTQPELKWISESQLRINSPDIHPRPGNLNSPDIHRRQEDLANFLNLDGQLSDQDPQVEIVTGQPVETEQINYATGKLINKGGESTTFRSMGCDISQI